MRKYILLLIFAALIIIEVLGAAQYFMVRSSFRHEMLAKAERDMVESKRVATTKAEVESAVRNILPDVQKAVENPDLFRGLTAQIVANNTNIVGAGVAFKPDYYPDRGNEERLYAPYAFDTRSEAELTSGKGKPNVNFNNLGFDYTDREWYQRPMTEGISLWTQPYVDKGGTHILMCTYVVPVRVGDKTVGVFFADVPLKDVSILAQNLSEGISRGGIVTVILQIASLFIIGIVIWLAVRASRRYKEQYVDPEKEHLANQLAKLREINTRQTKRIQELADKVNVLQRQVDAHSQKSDEHYFG